MIVRRWCQQIIHRRPSAVLALGVLGMADFVGTLVVIAMRRSTTQVLVASGVLSLAAYSLSLAVGYLGSPRMREPAVRREPSRPRMDITRSAS